MKLSYEMKSIPPGSTVLPIQGYQYWLLFTGRGEILTERETISLTAGGLIEIPSGLSVRIQSDEILSAGIIRLDDFLATNTKLHYFPDSRDVSLVRKTFLYTVEMLAETLPDPGKFHNRMDQVCFDLIIQATVLSVSEDMTVFPMISMINEHYTDPGFDLPRIFTQTEYSENYARKLFKKEVGLTPVDYLNNMRLTHAKYLLRSAGGKYTIKQAALDSGFRDPYYFSRLFQKKEGISPREYMKKSRREN